MKKIFALILTLCLVTCALCVTTFAADTEEDPADLSGIQLGDQVVIDDEDITSIEEKPGIDWWVWGHHGLGSLFGEGSLTMIIILAVIMAVAGGACFVVVKKRKSHKTKNSK